MNRRLGVSMRIASVVLMVLCATVVQAAPKDDELAAAHKTWKKQNRDQKVATVLKLAARPTADRLDSWARWLRDADPLVRGALLDATATAAIDVKLRSKVGLILAKYTRSHLAARKKREDAEFREVCRKHGKKAPEGFSTKGAWKDPYDEKKRKLPADIRKERLLAKRLVAAIERSEMPALRESLLAILDEHHDPAVVQACVEAVGRMKLWPALPVIADLLRPLEYGRWMDGSPQMGKKAYRTLRLKWDVHKDRLWWSRPEYVVRVRHPIFDAFRAITGQKLESARLIDRWLIDNESVLAKHGVKLDAGFRARTARTQR